MLRVALHSGCLKGNCFREYFLANLTNLLSNLSFSLRYFQLLSFLNTIFLRMRPVFLSSPSGICFRRPLSVSWCLWEAGCHSDNPWSCSIQTHAGNLADFSSVSRINRNRGWNSPVSIIEKIQFCPGALQPLLLQLRGPTSWCSTGVQLWQLGFTWDMGCLLWAVGCASVADNRGQERTQAARSGQAGVLQTSAHGVGTHCFDV